jgi:hypothetical protein
MQTAVGASPVQPRSVDGGEEAAGLHVGDRPLRSVDRAPVTTAAAFGTAVLVASLLQTAPAYAAATVMATAGRVARAARSTPRSGAAPAPTCYGAFTPSFSWCSGYAAAGYNCSGDYCASATCVGECYFCAVAYEGGAVLDSATGRCCGGGGSGPLRDGACSDPLPAVAPWNADYLWPDHHPALIVEGPAAYLNGPHVWSNGSAYNESGAYAFAVNSPGGKTDAECPALPANTTFDTTKVRPISLRDHGVAISDCVLACNWTAVEAGGADPCLPGSESGPGYVATMRCFWGGPGWLKGKDLGVCGYNCTALHPDTGALCDQADVDAGTCEVFCDERDFPGAGGW